MFIIVPTVFTASDRGSHRVDRTILPHKLLFDAGLEWEQPTLLTICIGSSKNLFRVPRIVVGLDMFHLLLQLGVGVVGGDVPCVVLHCWVGVMIL
jgi:hypothetical protein